MNFKNQTNKNARRNYYHVSRGESRIVLVDAHNLAEVLFNHAQNINSK